MDDSIILKYEIRVACNHAKSLSSVGSFNRVGFIIIPICVLKAQVGVARIISTLNIREVTHRAIMRRRGIIIFYKDAFAIHVGIFWPFFADEVHFAGDKVGWVNKA